MSLETVKKDAIAFFEEAINQWSVFFGICADISKAVDDGNGRKKITEADLIKAQNILVWFQTNYVKYKKYSNFSMRETFENGKTIKHDPIFNVIFGGATLVYIMKNRRDFADDITRGCAVLRGHLASVQDMKKINAEDQTPILRVRKILSRINLVENQLKRTRKDKITFEIQDEYDLQNLIHSILRIDFNDVRKEDVAPICAGAYSRIDLVLKAEKILIEVKKTSPSNREKEIGSQLVEDITRYKSYPNVNILVCFIYDPEHWIENPDGLIHDLESQSTQTLNLEVIICPKSQKWFVKNTWTIKPYLFS